MAYYAVARGRNIGIYESWDECQKQTNRFSKALFKKFKDRKEAEEFILKHNPDYVSNDDNNDFLKKDFEIKIRLDEEDGEGESEDGEIQAYRSNNDKDVIQISRKEIEDKCIKFMNDLFENYGSKAEYIEKDDFVYREDYYNLNKDEALVYVDGSYNNTYSNFSYGGIIINKEGNVTSVFGKGSKEDHELRKMRNVAGELVGTIELVKLAITLGYNKIYLHYDYAGIEHWVTGAWQTKKEWTEKYAQAMRRYQNCIDIEFLKVKGHSGVKYNDVADRLAAMAYDFHDS